MAAQLDLYRHSDAGLAQAYRQAAEARPRNAPDITSNKPND